MAWVTSMKVSVLEPSEYLPWYRHTASRPPWPLAYSFVAALLDCTQGARFDFRGKYNATSTANYE